MKFVIFFFTIFHLFGEDSSLRHALYLVKKGKPVEAIRLYRTSSIKENQHNYQILRELAGILLKQGIDSEDLETKMLATYGGGLSASKDSFSILEKALNYKNPSLQLIGLYFLSQLQDDRSRAVLEKAATKSDFLSTRVEACYHMALRKEKNASSLTQALMSSLPPFFRPFFPRFFALIGTKEADRELRQLLQDRNHLVRLEAILSLIQMKRDDFLPLIRLKASQRNIAEMEACAFAFGAMQDTHSINRLESFCTKSPMNVRIAALQSLVKLGDESKIQDLEILALSHNLFAIQALAQLKGSNDILFELIKSPNLQTQINAAIGLLQRRDPRCLPILEKFLLSDEREIGLHILHSVGGSQKAFKMISLPSKETEQGKNQRALCTHLKEQFLKEAMNLPEKDFLQLAKKVFDLKDSTLVPCVMHLLQNLQTKGAIELLQKQAEMLGAPFNRNYANLILFSLGEKGPYEKRIFTWLKKVNHRDQVRLRPHLSLKDREEISEYKLSTEEKSQLLLDTFSVLAARQGVKNIELLLETMEKANEKTRLALCGLLIRASE